MKKTVIALVAVAASAGLAAGAFYLSPASADSDSENALAELSAGPEVDYVPPPIQWVPAPTSCRRWSAWAPSADS